MYMYDISRLRVNPFVTLNHMYGVIKPGCVPELGYEMFFTWSILITCVLDVLQVCRRNSSTLGRVSSTSMHSTSWFRFRLTLTTFTSHGRASLVAL